VFETQFTERNGVKIAAYITYATSHLGGKAPAISTIFVIKDIKHLELAKYETDHVHAMNISMKTDINLTILAICCCPLQTVE
jgi:hypothetical protein